MSDKARDDSLLYTGTTSVSKRLQEKRDEAARAKDRTRVKLEPLAEVLNGFIEEEKAKIPEQVWELINADDGKEDVKSKLLALRMHKAYLENFKTRLDNTLRERNRKSNGQ